MNGYDSSREIDDPAAFLQQEEDENNEAAGQNNAASIGDHDVMLEKTLPDPRDDECGIPRVWESFYHTTIRGIHIAPPAV